MWTPASDSSRQPAHGEGWAGRPRRCFTSSAPPRHERPLTPARSDAAVRAPAREPAPCRGTTALDGGDRYASASIKEAKPWVYRHRRGGGVLGRRPRPGWTSWWWCRCRAGRSVVAPAVDGAAREQGARVVAPAVMAVASVIPVTATGWTSRWWCRCRAARSRCRPST